MLKALEKKFKGQGMENGIKFEGKGKDDLEHKCLMDSYAKGIPLDTTPLIEAAKEE